MIRRLKLFEAITVVLTLAILVLPAGCAKNAKNNAPKFVSGVLQITGNGVGQPCRYTVDELKGLQDAVVGVCYSTVNNVGTKNFFVGSGLSLSYLLTKAGISDTAKTIKITGADGYTIVLTREQLDERRCYFPGLMEGSDREAVEVPAILAWEHREGSRDLSQARGSGLRLLIGQTGLNEVVVPAFVRDVALIEVSTTEAGRWAPISAEPAPGEVEPGTGVVLQHPNLDTVKIYYTLDGSEPNEKSLVYNPGTTYFKQEPSRVIIVNQNMTIKALAVGLGKNNSDVATFAYKIH